MSRQKSRPANPKHGRRGRTVRLYRIWITRYEDWAPQNCLQLPPVAIAQEPAESEAMSARQAARYVEAFNRAALARRCKLWAVALPVAVRFEGEPRPGDTLTCPHSAAGSVAFHGFGQSPQCSR